MKATKNKGASRGRGRPSVCSEKVVLQVLEGLMEGMSLNAVCQERGMPSKRTWLRRVASDAGLRERYVSAMQIRAFSLADDCLDIADGELKTSEQIQAATLRIRTRQWDCQRLMPKVYGRDGWAGSTEDQVLPPIIQLSDLRVPVRCDDAVSGGL